MKLLILQQRAHKAGAQSALLRTLLTPAFQAQKVVVILGDCGWLSDEFERHQITYKIIPFPSSRSLKGKLFLNNLFVKKIVQSLGDFKPDTVIANDHGECILTLSLANKLITKSAAFLRSSPFTKEVFRKYQCPKFDTLFALGTPLYTKTCAWQTGGNVHLAHDGVSHGEFRAVTQKSPTFPTQWLVIGGDKAGKGWQDFAEAIRHAELDPDFPSITCDFTSESPTDDDNDMQLELPRRAKFNFLGRVPDIAKTAQNYGLCVHPSRHETFGLAAAEVIAVGVLLLASRTGFLAEIHANPAMVFEPSDPESMAQCFLHLFRNWDSLDLSLEKSQTLLRSQFLIDDQAEKIIETLTSST